MKSLAKTLPRMWAAFFLLIASVQIVSGVARHVNAKIFWDLNIYQSAVESYALNLNPYAVSSADLFIYHPLVLQLFTLANNKIGMALGFFYTLITLSFLLSLANRRELFIPFFLAFSFLGLGVLSIATGNVTLFLHLSLLSILIPGINSKKSKHLFNGAVVICSIIKPYMLAYLTIPCFMSFRKGEKITPSLKQGLAWLITFVLILGIHTAIFSDLFFDFYAALNAQIITKGDLGLSVYSYLTQVIKAQHIALALHFLIVGGCAFFVLRFFFSNKQADELAFVLALYFLLSLLNPRLKDYDIPPMLFALFGSAFLVTQSRYGVMFIGFANIGALINAYVNNGVFSKPGIVIYLAIALIVIFFIWATRREKLLPKQLTTQRDSPTVHTYPQT